MATQVHVPNAERSQLTKESLVAAARREFGWGGFETTIDEIVAAAHKSKGTWDHHFGSKETLWKAAVEDAKDQNSHLAVKIADFMISMRDDPDALLLIEHWLRLARSYHQARGRLASS